MSADSPNISFNMSILNFNFQSLMRKSSFSFLNFLKCSVLNASETHK